MYVDYRFNKNIISQAEQEALRKHPEYKLDGNTCVVLRHYYTEDEIARAKMVGISLEGNGKIGKIDGDHAFIRALRREFLAKVAEEQREVENDKVEVPKIDSLERLLEMKKEIEEKLKILEEEERKKATAIAQIEEVKNLLATLDNQDTTKYIIKAISSSKSTTFGLNETDIVTDLTGALGVILTNAIARLESKL